MVLGRMALLHIKKNLVYMRKNVLKLTLEELSNAIPISRDTLYRLENNLENNSPLYPNLKTLLMITDYLGIDIARFLSVDLEMEEVHRQDLISNIERMESMNVGKITT